MHVILATMGTDGDVFPHIGLGATLRSRGHRITLAAPEPYRERAISLGLEFSTIVTTAEVSQMLSDPDLWHPFRSGRMMARWGEPMIPRQYQALSNLAAQPGCVLVANPGVVAARLVQEKWGVPMASLLLQPGLLPSCVAPPEMPGGVTIPSWLPHSLRPLYWLAVDAAGYMLVAKSLNRFRSHLGLSPVRRLFRWWLSPKLVIGLFPAWYAAPAHDWPSQLRLAGFGRYDGQETIPEEIRSFCKEGAPPIVFTYGTGMTHASRFFRTAVHVCENLHVRSLLLTRYPTVLPYPLPRHMKHCTFAPLRQLLPHCAAIVHHGGIGTTAAALESGCPQLVLPLAWDQPDNAVRVAKLGAGLVLGSRRRSSDHMRRSLIQLMSPPFKDQCRTVATSIVGEDGMQQAARLVEQLGESNIRSEQL